MLALDYQEVLRGTPLPLGLQEFEGGVNFALYGRDAARVQLEFYRRVDDSRPQRVIELDPACNRTGDIWHVWVARVPEGQLYAYRVDGSLLLDPCAVAIKRAAAPENPSKCVFMHAEFDWGDDRPPRHPWSKTIIYETHVRGLTVHPSARVRYPGTYRGVIEKIPYLKNLGVTALELLPVHEFDSRSTHDYWGYAPVSFFAPNGAYSSAGDSGQQVAEIKEMVRQLHAADMEVIVDIVLAHDGQCGPVMRRAIIGALRHWVVDMHVDGFRFDLGTILGRDPQGKLLANAWVLEQIAEDPILRDTKLIAQAWDTAGAWKVGTFGEQRWAEWNRRYRDDVRRFWRGDRGMLGAFASRLCGSEDLYGGSGKGPECSINFVTCHDGLTLNDLVSYQGGTSANYGVEGPTVDERIEAVRERQIKNFLLTLFVSRGVPMLLGGDEFRRTQLGNNNAWCEDNETSWYDWQGLQQHTGIHDFVRRMVALRQAHPVLARELFYTPADIVWLAPQGGMPAWSDPQARSLGCLIREGAGEALCLLFNAEDKPVTFAIPAAPEGGQWRVAVDTNSETDIGSEIGRSRVLAPRSSAVLIGSR